MNQRTAAGPQSAFTAEQSCHERGRRPDGPKDGDLRSRIRTNQDEIVTSFRKLSVGDALHLRLNLAQLLVDKVLSEGPQMPNARVFVLARHAGGQIVLSVPDLAPTIVAHPDGPFTIDYAKGAIVDREGRVYLDLSSVMMVTRGDAPGIGGWYEHPPSQGDVRVRVSAKDTTAFFAGNSSAAQETLAKLAFLTHAFEQGSLNGQKFTLPDAVAAANDLIFGVERQRRGKNEIVLQTHFMISITAASLRLLQQERESGRAGTGTESLHDIMGQMFELGGGQDPFMDLLARVGRFSRHRSES